MRSRAGGIVGALLLSASCAGSPMPPNATSVELPSEPPTIVGIITAREGDRLRIEANPADSSGSPKAVVRLLPRTLIIGLDGTALPVDSLRVGRRVGAWFTGPVAESYPVQAVAATLMIQGPAGGPAPVTLQLDRARYRPGDRIELTLRNASGHSFAFNPCTRTVERAVAGETWQAVDEGNRICTMEAWLLAPRTERTAVTALPAMLPVGHYRLVLELTPDVPTPADTAPRPAPVTAAAIFQVE